MNRIVSFILLLFLIGTASADYTLPPHSVPAYHVGVSRVWIFADINLETGAQVTSNTSSFLSSGGYGGVGTGPAQPAISNTSTRTRAYPFVRLFIHASNSSSTPSNYRVYYYIVAQNNDNPSSTPFHGGPATTQDPANPTAPNITEPSAPIYIPPANLPPGLTPQMPAGGPTITNTDPTPPDNGGGGGTPPADGPGPANGGTGGFSGDGGTVPAGMERVYLLKVRLNNETPGLQRYAVTVRTSIGQVLWQGLVSVQPNTAINYEYLASEQATIEANLVYQGFADEFANPPDTTRGPTIEGTSTAWNVTPGQDPRTLTGGNTATSNVPGVTPGNRPGTSPDPNAEPRHAESMEGLRRIQGEVRDAAASVKAGIADSADRGKAAAEAASAQIKNSLEFVGGQLVAATHEVRDAVTAQTLPNETEPTDPTYTSLQAPPPLPSPTTTVNSDDIDSGEGTQSVLDNVAASKAAAGRLVTAMIAARDSLGLGAQLGNEQLVFNLTVPFIGSVTFDVEAIAGSFLDLLRQVFSFFLGLWFVQALFSAVREAFV